MARFNPSILPQAGALGLLLYGMVMGTAATVAVGVIMAGVAAASRKDDAAEQ